ncbi:hypothetical protein M1B35_12690 [Pseudomonas sp. MAFF 302046]|uniref:Uncharacterized protein n=1 Tax=Pseudomonas morbosilactucae TaxID=2938197 RepID=A0ABT0JGH1_9PSED|nr:hypothetical protein [Pseudomonas morbosilactucae]MCK9814960.1 hypothetical protein [Pseudomonas morbosilactucae]
MALPERLQPLKPTPSQWDAMSILLRTLEEQIELNHEQENAAISTLIEQWNSLVGRPFEFDEFRDLHSHTNAEDFIRSTFHHERYVDDLSFEEACALARFVSHSEGDDSDVHYALKLLEINFANAEASDLIFWPDDWFNDPDLLDVELTPQEIVGYLMAKSGRRLADAPPITLRYAMP